MQACPLGVGPSACCVTRRSRRHQGLLLPRQRFVKANRWAERLDIRKHGKSQDAADGETSLTQVRLSCALNGVHVKQLINVAR